jgi:hypothetical protein
MMKNKNVSYKRICIPLILAILTAQLIACAGDKFLGAQKIGGSSVYVERWFLNDEYNKKNIPKGTAFYGASAQKIKHKFTLKYYINDKKGSVIEIPKKDMWKVRHNGKRYNLQDDDNLFFYVKNRQGDYEKYLVSSKATGPITVNRDVSLLPIKSCEDDWCLLYPNVFEKPMYVKQVILYQDGDI